MDITNSSYGYHQDIHTIMILTELQPPVGTLLGNCCAFKHVRLWNIMMKLGSKLLDEKETPVHKICNKYFII